jgi:hypothetical protein
MKQNILYVGLDVDDTQYCAARPSRQTVLMWATWLWVPIICVV